MTPAGNSSARTGSRRRARWRAARRRPPAGRGGPGGAALARRVPALEHHAQRRSEGRLAHEPGVAEYPRQLGHGSLVARGPAEAEHDPGDQPVKIDQATTVNNPRQYVEFNVGLLKAAKDKTVQEKRLLLPNYDSLYKLYLITKNKI